MLKRDKLEPERYEYLNLFDSALYDSVKDSKEGKDLIIKGLLESKAASSRSEHRRSTY